MFANEQTATSLKRTAPPIEAPSRKRPTPGSRDCLVCTEAVDHSRYPDPLQLPSHQHGSDICHTCWESHLKSKIETTRSDEINCAQCSRILTEEEFRVLASEETYTRYVDKATATWLANDEEFFSCTSAVCQFGGFISKNDGNIFRCQLCQARSCVECKAPFHDGLTCEDFQSITRRDEEHEQSAAKLKAISPICTHQWCWKCAAPYKGAKGIALIGNLAHAADCPFHPDNLPPFPADMETETEDESESEAEVEEESESEAEEESEPEVEEESESEDEWPLVKKSTAPNPRTRYREDSESEEEVPLLKKGQVRKPRTCRS